LKAACHSAFQEEMLLPVFYKNLPIRAGIQACKIKINFALIFVLHMILNLLTIYPEAKEKD
jgi:hypothetical protein